MWGQVSPRRFKRTFGCPSLPTRLMVTPCIRYDRSSQYQILTQVSLKKIILCNLFSCFYSFCTSLVLVVRIQLTYCVEYYQTEIYGVHIFYRLSAIFRIQCCSLGAMHHHIGRYQSYDDWGEAPKTGVVPRTPQTLLCLALHRGLPSITLCEYTAVATDLCMRRVVAFQRYSSDSFPSLKVGSVHVCVCQTPILR